MSRFRLNRFGVYRPPVVEPPPPASNTIAVPAGSNLQTFLNAAQPGDELVLEPGTYTGNFTVGSRSNWVTVRGASATPGAIVIHSPNNSPAIQTDLSASFWWFADFTMTAAHENGDLLRLGSSIHTSDQIAHDFVVERIWFKGSVTVGKRRAIALNCAYATIRNCTCTDIKYAGADAQFIGGWNGPGPFLIDNNTVEAAGTPILFGGADPSIPDLVPSDITFTNNVVTRPLSWKDEAWTVKNLFELKTGRRVLIQGNTFSNNWANNANQNQGYSFWFKSVNQDGNGGLQQVYDVEWINNVATNLSAGINLHRDPKANGNSALPFSLMRIANSYFEITSSVYGGPGIFLQFWGVDDVTVDHNTVMNDGGATIYVSEGSSPNNERFVLTNNILKDNSNSLGAIRGPLFAEGIPTLNQYFSGYTMAGNLMQTSGGSYPAGNNYVASLSGAGYDATTRLLSPTSPYKGTATDGTDPGWTG